MQVLAQITLNFQQPNFVTVYAAQNDRLSRFINTALLDGATPWTFPTGALMTIRYRKPDGTSGWYDTLEDGSPAYTIEEDGSITFGLAEQALTVPGMVPVELNFYNAAGAKLSTLTFIVAVKPSAYSDEDIASSDYYNILTAKMQQLAELADSAEGDYQEYLSALSGFVGAPRTAAVAADMLDTGLIYVYTGSETGWTYGDWYYYNGREWVSGGVYNSAAISLDDTLTNANKPAQAKAAGDLVLVQDTQPAATVNKLWFPLTEPTDEQVPTWDEFSELKSSISVVVSTESILEWTERKKTDTDIPILNGYTNSDGSFKSSSGYITVIYAITENCLVYPVTGVSWKRFAIYSSSELSTSTFVYWYGSNVPTEENPASMSAGQYAVFTVKQNAGADNRASIFVGITRNEHSVRPDLELTPAMTSQVDDRIASAIEAERNPTSVSSLLYRRNLPSYYTALPASTSSFDDDEYIQKRIQAIPDGKHFIFVTDTHWDHGKNARKSNDLIQYVRSRIGDVEVVFGGDVLNAISGTPSSQYYDPNAKYTAVKVIKSYFNECIDAYGNRFLPVLGNHDVNGIGQQAEYADTWFIPYSAVSPLFTDHLKGRAAFRDETEAIAEKTSDPALAAEYDAYFRLNYVVNTKDGITFIVYNTGAGGPFTREAFGLAGENEIYLHQQWLYNALMNVPAGNDVVLVGHEATYGRAEPLGSWHHKSAVTLLCGFNAKQSVKLYLDDPAISEYTTPWVPSTRYPTYDFTGAPNVGKVFLMQGHWHHDWALKVGINADQSGVSYTRLSVAEWDGSAHFSKASGEIPIITTICDAYGAYNVNSSYPNDPVDWDMSQLAGTVEEQAFDVVTITETGVVTTRFGASERPENLLREFVFEA